MSLIQASLRRRALGWLAVLAACQPLWAAVVVDVSPDKEAGVYAPGDTVTWSVNVTNDDKPATGEVAWTLLKGGLAPVASGKQALDGGKASLTGTRADAGTLLLQVNYEATPGQRTTGLGGAAFGIDQIKPSAPTPDDFGSFWAGKIAALKAVPMNVQITPVDIGKPDLEYFKVDMDGYNGSKIHGQLCRPKGKTNLPGLLQVQWAGVYPLSRDWVVGPASQGWLAFNIIAHDLPIDEPAQFYKDQDANQLKGYPAIGREDRETSYFLRMYLSCYRAVDYLIGRPEFDGKTVLVQGGSQGGGQSLITAGLHPAVTAIAADVPAMCDHTGHLADRAPGWPRLCGWGLKPDSEKTLVACRYFDAVNFAKRAHCKTALVGIGLIDTTCPPEGCLAAYNALPCTKQLVLMPKRGHGGDHGAYYAAYGKFVDGVRRGQ
ncbi:MAG: acetylxylan esterase [Armatimonadetes bacterium]|nr:acetylxylan esterase [Armatimonadota bacterium]